MTDDRDLVRRLREAATFFVAQEPVHSLLAEAADALSHPVPEGWRLVPVETTTARQLIQQARSKDPSENWADPNRYEPIVEVDAEWLSRLLDAYEAAMARPAGVQLSYEERYSVAERRAKRAIGRGGVK